MSAPKVPEADDSPMRRGRVTWASEIEPEPVEWMWEDDGEGRISAGVLALAAGREGTGKSCFGIWASAQVSRGTLPGSLHGTPRNVLYVAVEDGWKQVLSPRLVSAGADRSRVGRFDVLGWEDEVLSLHLPSDNALLEQTIAEYEVALVVIDPLMSVLSARLDTHKERDVRSALDPLVGIAERTGAVILGIAHFNKGGGSDAANMITGSGAFKNVPRAVFGFAADEDGSKVMTQVKNSYGRYDLPSLSYVSEEVLIPTSTGMPARTVKLTWTGTADRTVADILRDSPQRRERHDAATWIRAHLTGCGGSAPAGEVIKAGTAAGYPESTLKNARSKVAETKRTGFGKDQIVEWTLPTGTAAGTAGTTSPTPGPAVPQVVPAPQGYDNGDDRESDPEIPRAVRLPGRELGGRIMTEPPETCAVPGCAAPARNRLWTCWPHALEELHYRSTASA